MKKIILMMSIVVTGVVQGARPPLQLPSPKPVGPARIAIPDYNAAAAAKKVDFKKREQLTDAHTAAAAEQSHLTAQPNLKDANYVELEDSHALADPHAHDNYLTIVDHLDSQTLISEPTHNTYMTVNNTRPQISVAPNSTDLILPEDSYGSHPDSFSNPTDSYSNPLYGSVHTEEPLYAEPAGSSLAQEKLSSNFDKRPYPLSNATYETINKSQTPPPLPTSPRPTSYHQPVVHSTENQIYGEALYTNVAGAATTDLSNSVAVDNVTSTEMVQAQTDADAVADPEEFDKLKFTTVQQLESFIKEINKHSELLTKEMGFDSKNNAFTGNNSTFADQRLAQLDKQHTKIIKNLDALAKLYNDKTVSDQVAAIKNSVDDSYTTYRTALHADTTPSKGRIKINSSDVTLGQTIKKLNSTETLNETQLEYAKKLIETYGSVEGVHAWKSDLKTLESKITQVNKVSSTPLSQDSSTSVSLVAQPVQAALAASVPTVVTAPVNNSIQSTVAPAQAADV